jgi:hypothetical protein
VKVNKFDGASLEMNGPDTGGSGRLGVGKKKGGEMAGRGVETFLCLPVCFREPSSKIQGQVKMECSIPTGRMQGPGAKQHVKFRARFAAVLAQ